MGRDMFRTLDERDVLVHFPHDSYADSVVALLDQASADPALLAIKQTLFRPAPDGPTVRALVRAAERGAHVVAVADLVDRRAEPDSLASARALERAGAHVVNGVVGLGIRGALTLVIRDAGGRLSRYGIVGTALHHPTRRPEGLCLLTSDSDITADLTDLFNYLTGYSRPAPYRKLLVAPGHAPHRLLALVRREAAAGLSGRIALKVHGLDDGEIVDALERASQRGARVDLVVTGGRDVETSRVFAFGSGEASSVYLSSGDLLLADLDRYVDVAAPVDDPVHRLRLWAMVESRLRFTARAATGVAGAVVREGATLGR